MDNQQIGIYDEMQARAELAYLAFSKQYAIENPPPERAALRRDVVSLAIVFSLVVVMIAGVVVSSSRTIEEFGTGGNQTVGVSAFVMLEGGLVAYAFFRARRSAAEGRERVGNARRLATIGLTLAFVSALAANIHAVMKASPEAVVVPFIETLIGLLVAVSAPTLAFISADVLAIELMSGDVRQRAADAEHDRLMNDWRAALRDEWQRRQRTMGVSWKVERASDQTSERTDRQTAPALPVSDQTDRQTAALPAGQTVSGHYGYTRTPGGQAAVIEYLKANPGSEKLSARDIAKLTGVSPDTANKGRNAYVSMMSVEVEN